MSDRSRLSSRIVRTPYGVTAVAMNSAWYAGDLWENLRDKFSAEHRSGVARNIANLPGNLVGSSTGWRDLSGPHVDGRTAEWWSIIVHDGAPDE